MDFTKTDLKKLEKLEIDALILFGSQAQQISRDSSDYDFFVIGKKNKETYDELYDLLTDKINRLVNIDIVFNSSAPMELKYHIIKYGQILFQKNDRIFANFKQTVMTVYQDFAPYRELYQKTTLARIA